MVLTPRLGKLFAKGGRWNQMRWNQVFRGGWKHEAALRVERQFRQEVLFERVGLRLVSESPPTSLVRDLDLPVPEAADNRRLEMWSRMGCPFFGGSTIGVGHDAGVRLAL